MSESWVSQDQSQYLPQTTHSAFAHELWCGHTTPSNNSAVSFIPQRPALATPLGIYVDCSSAESLGFCDTPIEAQQAEARCSWTVSAWEVLAANCGAQKRKRYVEAQSPEMDERPCKQRRTCAGRADRALSSVSSKRWRAVHTSRRGQMRL